MPIYQNLVLGFWCPSLEMRMGEGLAMRAFGDNHEQMTAMFNGLQAGQPISLDPRMTAHLNELQVVSSSRFLYGPTNDFSLAEAMLANDPELRDVQSLMTVDGFGKGPPPKRAMPPGYWAVFYGKVNHHMLKVTRWNQEVVGLAFETSDLHTLQAIINDQPLQVTRL